VACLFLFDIQVAFYDDFAKVTRVIGTALRFVRTRSLRLNWDVRLLSVACAGLLAGCASKDLQGVEEYKQITAQAVTAIQAALQSLDRVSAAPAPCPAQIVEDLSRNVQRLEVDSIKVRARSQAILARGDAYFADWSKSIARIKDPKVRELADRFHPQLEQSFAKIKTSSQQAGAALKPFLSGLRELRVKLETNPAGVKGSPVQDLIRNTRESGREVIHELDSISSELSTITRLLTPAQHTAKQ
jgi:hypothetical protein